MLKSTFFGALILLCAVAVADARVEWRGKGKSISMSQTCRDVGWPKKVKGNIRFRPSDISDNGDYSRLATHLDYVAYGLKRKGRFDDKLRHVEAHGVSASGWGPVAGAKFRFVSIKPSSFTDRTKKIKVVAEFTNYAGDAGCTMKWKGTLERTK